ncbi:MAG TPA: MFS transporter [Candidatus Scatomonas pullistercoris]|uniref:MFS transporter n=1 Tax=Candidatus Scatomonas pullistercoris TaxID=2840920 RepID=A0A9D1TB54_9FIRM|nr:MFS transporter [Candidatus Scatomonas pullistercoris]
MKVSKAKLCLSITGIFILAFVSMYTSLYYPAVSDMYGIYGEQISAVNYFVSGASICTLIIMILVPFLEKLMGSKKLLLFGAILISAGGLLGLLTDNIILYNIANSLALGGYGITGTMTLSILMALITDPARRGLFNGLYQVIVAVSGSVLAVIGGVLTLQSWRSALSAAWWLCLILGIISTVILAFSIPKNIKTAEKEDDSLSQETGKQKIPWGKILPAFVAFLVLGTIYQYANLLLSVYVSENAIGNSAFIGTMQSLGTIGSAVMCFCFAFVYRKIGKRIILAPMAVITVFIFLMSTAPSQITVILASLLMGVAFGCSITFFYTICPEIAPHHVTLAVALIGIAANLPYSTYSYIYTFMSGIFDTMTASLKPMFLIMLVELVMTAFYFVLRKKAKRM